MALRAVVADDLAHLLPLQKADVAGPTNMQSSTRVIAAPNVRKVMYWNTLESVARVQRKEQQKEHDGMLRIFEKRVNHDRALVF